jgi:hypothetical protein
MQSLAFLWSDMQMTQQYLREQTFGPAPSSTNSANLKRPIDVGMLRRESVEFNQEDEQLPEDASTQEQGTRVISFCLDTHTGEMSFDPEEQGTQDVSAETALG